MSKRKAPEPRSAPRGTLPPTDKRILSLIKNREDRGIASSALSSELKTPTEPNILPAVFKKSIANLLALNLIKEVVPIRKFGKGKHYMATEFEPSPEIFGGAWHSAGALDMTLVENYKIHCFNAIKELKVATMEMIFDVVRRKGEIQEAWMAGEIVQALVLENSVVEAKSTGEGEFEKVKAGKVCYKVRGRGRRGEGGEGGGALASVPCGVCPRINMCSPDGIVSPISCTYFTKWLEF